MGMQCFTYILWQHYRSIPLYSSLNPRRLGFSHMLEIYKKKVCLHAHVRKCVINNRLKYEVICSKRGIYGLKNCHKRSYVNRKILARLFEIWELCARRRFEPLVYTLAQEWPLLKNLITQKVGFVNDS